MRAKHKYKEAAKRGNKEAQRRIAQSYGYRISLWDMPHMVNLLTRAKILDTIDTDSVNTIDKSHNIADTQTISL